jgi:nitroimidazol reductase NimA-like FMN-containing flavoprotein (pyridoxamine 5'-phosphate oxidase superfamily)
VADLIGGADEQTRVRRLPELASYERDQIYSIIDATTLCHVGVIVDGRPLVLPTLHVRQGDSILLHGSVSSLLLRSAPLLDEVSVAVTLVDGLIVARSTFNSSFAYRSVMAFGPARIVDDPAHAERALDALVEGILPGRSDEVRRPSTSELRRTRVVEVQIARASAKVSVGPPSDEPDDVLTDAWAGTIPLAQVWGTPIAAPDGEVGRGAIPVPRSVARLVGGQ